jgi:hypothetical protein
LAASLLPFDLAIFRPNRKIKSFFRIIPSIFISKRLLATFDNGLLEIELVREIPEAMKPRRIAINGASNADSVHQIEAKAA